MWYGHLEIPVLNSTHFILMGNFFFGGVGDGVGEGEGLCVGLGLDMGFSWVLGILDIALHCVIKMSP
jgi:hypothetical protein